MVSRDTAGSAFANIHDFKSLFFANEFQKLSLQLLLKINALRKIPDISIFAEREISTVKISVFQVTALIKLVILQIHIFL